jgi:hypothetical protein
LSAQVQPESIFHAASPNRDSMILIEYDTAGYS